MPRIVFGNLREFRNYVERLLRHAAFSKNEPHVFLFAETPFLKKYYPREQEVKRVVGRISELLRRLHPLSRIAFSINELTAGGYAAKDGRAFDTHSNTGYLVEGSGHSNYPKILLADTDATNARHRITREKVPFRSANEAQELHWKARAEQTSRDENPFLRATISVGRRRVFNIEHRVCGDTSISEKRRPTLAIVSAWNLNARQLAPAYEQRKLVIVNDLVRGRKVLSRQEKTRFFLDAPHSIEASTPFDDEMVEDSGPEKEALEKLLERHAIRIYLAD